VWLIHYIAVAITGVGAYVIYSAGRNKYLSNSKGGEPISSDEFMYILSIIVIVASIMSIFFHYFSAYSLD
jgi:hypothetical protein